MVVELARPVGGGAAGCAVGTQLDRALEVAQLHAERREGREAINDDPTAVAGVTITCLRIRARSYRTRRTDRMRHPLVFAPGIRGAERLVEDRLAERTPADRLLGRHYGDALLSSPPATVQCRGTGRDTTVAVHRRMSYSVFHGLIPATKRMVETVLTGELTHRFEDPRTIRSNWGVSYNSNQSDDVLMNESGSFFRRGLLGASVSVLGALSGCSALVRDVRPGLPDFRVKNGTERAISVDMDVVNQETGDKVIDETVALANFAEEGSVKEYRNPITNQDAHDVVVNIHDGPDDSDTWEDGHNTILNTGDKMLVIGVYEDRIEFLHPQK